MSLDDLMAEFEEKNLALKEATKIAKAADLARQDVVRKIAKEIAPRKEINYDGKRLVIVFRNSKNGVESCYFRGLDEKEDDAPIVVKKRLEA